MGAAIAAFAIEEFLVAKQILDGGVVGISIILNHIFKLKLSVFIVVLNIPFLALGWKLLGKGFALRSTYAMIVFSIFLVLLEDMDELTADPLLATVYGGLFLGLGVGLIMRGGGCVDGLDTVSLLLSRKTQLSTGQIILGFNMVIYCVAGFIFGLDRALYSLLTYFITSKVIDIVETGLEQGKAVMIITENGERIADNIYKGLGRTVTLLEGEGLISGRKIVLYCVVTRLELSELKRIVREDDGSAFMTISDVSEIVGKHIKKFDKAEN
jgi:uncharacterized membrane-anchored protein YitT (DUF2179 family)